MIQAESLPCHWCQDKITVCLSSPVVIFIVYPEYDRSTSPRPSPGEFNARNFGESQWWVGRPGK